MELLYMKCAIEFFFTFFHIEVIMDPFQVFIYM